MRILVSGGTASMRRFSQIPTWRPYLGHLVVPRARNRMTEISATGLPFACDNGAFSAFNKRLFARMIQDVLPYGPEWLVLPDVVACSRVTIGLYDWWASRVLPIELAEQVPYALVAQDGLEDCDWDYWLPQAACLFIGGSTDFKLSREAAVLAQLAKQQGLAVHMGRVNSIKRLLYAAEIGCDSIDGMSFNKFGDTYIPAAVKALMEFHGDRNAATIKPAKRVRKAA